MSDREFERQRLGATLRAFHALRHEFATPLSAAALQLELARRAALRAGDGVPQNLRTSLEAGRKAFDETVLLLEGFSTIGDAHAEEPALLDFAALVSRAVRETDPEFVERGGRLGVRGPSHGVFVNGFEDEIERAVREVLLTAARWAVPGDALVEVADGKGTASFQIRVPLGGERPGKRLFRANSRPGAGIGPWLARWTFEAHGGSLVGKEDATHLTAVASLPRVARR